MKKRDIDNHRDAECEYGALRAAGTPQLTRHVPTLPGRWRNYYENIAHVLLARKRKAGTKGGSISLFPAIGALSHFASSRMTQRHHRCPWCPPRPSDAWSPCWKPHSDR